MSNGHGGQRHNSGGKREGAGRKPEAIRTLRKQALETAGPDAERALAFIISVMDDMKQPVRMRYAAAVELLDRAWGKATQKNVNENSGTIKVKTYVNVSPDDWDKE